jgi:signal transduction histidine kinase
VDVTELKEVQAGLEGLVAERTARLQETVGELEYFSYTITHDMRAPLRAMQGFGGLLLQECTDCMHPQRRDFIRRIAQSAERMDSLITDALNYSKVVRQQLEVEPLDAGALLRGMIESYPQFQPPKAEVEIAGSIPLVLGNQAGLTQCFSNLLGNAVKFVHPDTVPKVRIWAEEKVVSERISESMSEKAGAEPSLTHSPTDSLTSSFVRIWFEDNGIGIAKHHQDLIFTLFQRLSKSYEGTGIGLALVRKVVERMKGRVGVESEEGQGSRFWIELPQYNGRNTNDESSRSAVCGG